MFSLDNREKALLLGIARRAVVTAVDATSEFAKESAHESAAIECSGAFVTLKRRGRLRGCIGQIVSHVRAAEVVAYAARAAALEDARFEPVRLDELPEIEIEISLLSPPEQIKPEEIEAGRHGLIVSRQFQRGVLLPQVATEHQWGGLRLLEETCLKAGLERDSWKDPDTQILAFTAQVFSESDVASEMKAPA